MARKKTTKAAKPAAAPVNGELSRVFVYNGIELPDIGSDKSPAEVKDFYSATYPALLNALVKGPDVAGDKEKWTFQAATGTRG